MLSALIFYEVNSWAADYRFVFIFNCYGGGTTSCNSFVKNTVWKLKAFPFREIVHMLRNNERFGTHVFHYFTVYFIFNLTSFFI